jgi:dUTP pyrophosphatase
MILEYKKRENAKSPMRANPSDAGLDVFYCPADPNVSAARLDPGENQLFSTGLRFGVPHGYMLQVCNRSSMGAKRSLIVGAHIIDSGYDGEIFIDLHNIGKETQFVSTGDKIAQLILVPVVHFRALETKEEDLYNEPITISNRGDGALGSTDKKTAPSTAQSDMADRHGLGDLLRKGWLPNGF